jgi:hypothetical protein
MTAQSERIPVYCREMVQCAIDALEAEQYGKAWLTLTVMLRHDWQNAEAVVPGEMTDNGRNG